MDKSYQDVYTISGPKRALKKPEIPGFRVCKRVDRPQEVPHNSGMPTKPTGRPRGRPRKPACQDRIRYLAGRGLSPADISAFLIKEGVRISAEMLVARHAEDMAIGRAEANLKVGENLFERATSPNGKFEALFWAKCRMGWAETAAGRKGAAAENDEDEVKGLTFEFVDVDADGKPKLKSLPGGKKASG